MVSTSKSFFWRRNGLAFSLEKIRVWCYAAIHRRLSTNMEREIYPVEELLA